MFACTPRVVRPVPFVPRMSSRLPRSANVPRAHVALRPSRAPYATHRSHSRTDNHPERKTITVPTTEEVRAWAKEQFSSLKLDRSLVQQKFQGLKNCLKPKSLTSEYPLDKIRGVQEQLSPALRGKKLEEDPIFVRNYLIHTYQDHEGHHLSLSILGGFYGFGSGVAAALFFDVSAPVLGSAIVLSNLWLWSRVRYHSRAMEQIRNKIIVVERTLENDGYGFTSFLGHKPNETNYTHYTKITKVGDKV